MERKLNRKEREMRATVARKIFEGRLLTESEFVIAWEAGIYDVKFSDMEVFYASLKASHYKSPTLEGYLCAKHKTPDLGKGMFCGFGIHADQLDPKYLTEENKDYLGYLIKPEAETFTQWGIKYPWHTSNEPYPADANGDCTCQCIYCKAYGIHKATSESHIHTHTP